MGAWEFSVWPWYFIINVDNQVYDKETPLGRVIGGSCKAFKV